MGLLDLWQGMIKLIYRVVADILSAEVRLVAEWCQIRMCRTWGLFTIPKCKDTDLAVATWDSDVLFRIRSVLQRFKACNYLLGEAMMLKYVFKDLPSHSRSVWDKVCYQLNW